MNLQAFFVLQNWNSIPMKQILIFPLPQAPSNHQIFKKHPVWAKEDLSTGRI